MLIRKAGESSWHSPTILAYPDERALQSVIEQSPDLLPGSTGTSMAVVNELAVPLVGYVDLIAVDAAGAITLVECKLKANPEIRRQVIGQVFAYAAGLWELSYEGFDQAFTARAGVPLAHRMAALNPDGWDEEEFRSSVASNLASGRFRLVIAVDQLTEELKRTVLYLNEHTVPEVQVLALELGYVADEGVEILVPAIYGQESVQRKAAPAQRRWDEATVFAALADCCSTDGVMAARRLYDFVRSRGATFNWGVGPLAAVTARLPVNGGKPASILSLYEWPKGKGGVAINFEYMQEVPTELKSRLAERLRTIPGVVERFVGLEQASFRKRPTLSIDQVLTQMGAVETIEAALDEVIAS